jgi:poly-gamma-glutamate capsule biosynthesis protein CapA/YwtB (metallophosphatase superfamily)
VSGQRLLEPVGPVRLNVAALGDVGVIGSARVRAAREGWDAVFAAVAPALRTADLGFANLEMPVAEAGEVRPGRSPEFRHDAEVLPALARAGVRVLSLANNHIMDCGRRGLERTLSACESAGLACAGAGHDLAAARRPAELVVRSQRVVLLAYAAASKESARAGTPGPAPLETAVLREDLERWRSRADVLVVSVHWGSMYVDYPPPRVLELAEVLERGGADLVLGHHPHVLQGWRPAGRCLTLFSLGDVVFDARAGDFEARGVRDTPRERSLHRERGGRARAGRAAAHARSRRLAAGSGRGPGTRPDRAPDGPGRGAHGRA